MEKLVKVILSKPGTILSIYVSFVIFGIIALFDLKIAILPEIGFPKAVVETKFPFAGIEEVEALISKPISERLGSSRGVKSVYAVSEPGVSQVTITFANNRDLEFKISELREKLEQVRELLPQNSEKPILSRFDPNSGPFLEMVFFPDKLNNPVLLKSYLEENWKPVLERIEGVASLQIGGGYEKEILAEIDAKRLLAYKLSPQSVGRAVVLSNRNVPAGSVPAGDKEVLVRVKGAASSIEELGKTVITVGPNGEPVLFGDFADLKINYRKRSEKALFNGKECVILYFYKESGANPVEVSERILEEANQIYKSSRSEVQFETGFDEANYVKQSVNGLRLSLLIGAGLAFLVSLLLLRNFSSPIVLMLIVPAAVLISFFLFWIFGLSLNMMSLGGLAVGIGMLFDNSNVVLSAIERNLDSSQNKLKACMSGISETILSVIIATISTLLVFIPMVFLKTFIGSLFSEMALAISISLLVSLVISITLTPVLYYLIPLMYAKKNSFYDRLFIRSESYEIRFIKWHSWLLEGLLKNPKGSVGWIFILIFLSGVSVYFISKEILPKMETGEFAIRLKFPFGTIRERVEESTIALESFIKEKYQVSDSISRIGKESQSGKDGGLTVDPSSEIRFIIGSWHRSSTSRIVESIKSDLFEEFPNLNSNVKYSGDVLSSIVGAESEIILELKGEEVPELEKLGKRLEAKGSSIPGVRKISHALGDSVRSYTLNFDESKLLRYGWSLDSVGDSLRIATLGGYFSGVELEGKEIPIRLIFRGVDIQNLDSVRNFGIPVGEKSVSISELSEIEEENNYRYLYGIGGQRANFITFFSDPGKESEVLRGVNNFIRSEEFPMEISLGLQESADYSAVIKELSFTIILAFIVLYLLISGQFESIRVANRILITIPLVVLGAIPFLFLFGRSINASSFVGLIMLMGISIDSAVLFYEYFLIEKSKKVSNPIASKKSANIILKPVLMNSTTTFVGLLPIMFVLMPGSEFQASMAVVVGFGVILSLLNAIFLMPLLFSLMEEKA
ncbi:efflux RND transporter permease subunit [Leptospira andrefontaineae]|uniref:Efflux RND transporter permease subunit n=1 Tax=Leptospira andrefontaineae TaxID=2484976 RepID=A0A4R9H6P8_9LEPT|nr:efflux RND transporter permease subunit [Leptospira andrefontaineae]TGK41264.1 efflux RND transporter permease subunit [Leptospira andrefontaineae]